MPSSTSIVLTLALVSTIAPSLAVPVYGSYSYEIAKRDEQLARDLEYILARADESGALSFKDIENKVVSGVKSVAKYAGPIIKAAAPYALKAAADLVARGDEELFVRLDARDQELVLREILEARGKKWDKFKQVAGKIGHSIIKGANAVAPLVASGAQIASALKEREDEMDLFARELDARDDAAYELIARALYDLD